MRGFVTTGTIAGLVLVAGLALAKAPDTSLRPVARPGSGQVERAETAPPVPQSTASATRPETRPETGAQTVAKRPKSRPAQSAVTRRDERGHLEARKPQRDQEQVIVVAQPQQSTERRGLFRSLRPLLRPRAVGKKAIARKNELARGAVCGDVAIQGVEIGSVPGKLNGCGVIKAVKVREVSGVGLSQQAVMDCVTAKALKHWINNGMKPAVGNHGGGVARIRVAAHYACRTRNNQRGAKISEHGRGRAIDISGFTLRDGSTITVLTDWNKGGKGKALRNMHKSACGAFGTVLGPEANRYHLDHFHFDTARYRSGSYCR
ncbi:extensin-like domain-containing protein [Roseovarius pelagicus]|uniref:Extensin family protein n=1 Tax=Roseovarius pelagicus TaxID=2980108 RepID=A0ABY6DGD2_9RHOB|nr:extensin family protein [Roseovarius pelagicus]